MGLLKVYVIVYVIVSWSGWMTKLTPVLWNILHKTNLDYPFFCHQRFEIKIETTLNVYALCPLLRGWHHYIGL